MGFGLWLSGFGWFLCCWLSYCSDETVQDAAYFGASARKLAGMTFREKSELKSNFDLSFNLED